MGPIRAVGGGAEAMTSADRDPHPVPSVPHVAPPRRTIVGYWEILTPIIALVCVGAGWQEAGDKSGRLRLIVTQALQ